MKYFIADDGEYVMPLDCFKEWLIEDDLEEMKLLEVKRDIGGEMYCHKKEDFIEKGDCGRWCKQYSPCNGKSGRCRNLENGFAITGKKFLLTKDGLKEIDKVMNFDKYKENGIPFDPESEGQVTEQEEEIINKALEQQDE